MILTRAAFLSIVIFLFAFQNIRSQGIITTVAGGGIGENVSATNTAVNTGKVALDRQNNLYYVSQLTIKKINASTGIITTIAGDGEVGFNGYGDGGPALSARFNGVTSMAVDHSGNIYLIDATRIRRIDGVTGIIITIAGGGTPCCNYNDGIPATSANFGSIIDIAVDASSNIYIADYYFSKIRKITASTGIISTVAGTGTFGYNGDNITATSAHLLSPCAVAVDAAGNIVIGDNGNSRIRKVTKSTGIITTIAGNGTVGFSGDGGPATSAKLNLWTGFNATYVYNLSVDSAGNVYVVDNGRVRKIFATNHTINTVAGNGTTAYSGDGANAASAGIDARSVAVDSAGNFYIPGNRRIRRVEQQTNIINTIAGNGTAGYGGENGSALKAMLYFPSSIATDTSGNLYINDQTSNQLRKVDAVSGIISTFAGTGTAGYNGDNINAMQAQLFSPSAITIDRFNNLYIADGGNNRIRRINLLTNIITTIAGTGTAGSDGDNGMANAAKISNPGNVGADDSGNIYISDKFYFNNRVRKISTTGYIYTLLQTQNPFMGNDPAGNLYFISNDTSLTLLMKLDKLTGNTDTIAGNRAGYAGDGGLAKAALLHGVTAITFDRIGNLFIADKNNHRIRMVNTEGIITTVAGNGIAGYSGDDSVSTKAKLNGPAAIVFSRKGDMLIADESNRRIRKVTGGNFMTWVCPGQNKMMQTNLAGSTYQWQWNTGNGFTNITDNAGYTGTNSPVLQFFNLNSLWYGYEFRCLTDGYSGYIYTLKFNNVWTGNFSQAWEDAANWSCGSMPDRNTDVIITSGTVVLNSNTTIRSITLRPNANIQISTGNNLTVAH